MFVFVYVCEAGVGVYRLLLQLELRMCVHFQESDLHLDKSAGEVSAKNILSRRGATVEMKISGACASPGGCVRARVYVVGGGMRQHMRSVISGPPLPLSVTLLPLIVANEE